MNTPTVDLYDAPDDTSREDLIKEIRIKYPNIPLFMVSTPRNGRYVVRPQELSDVKVATSKVDEFVQKKIDSMGGYEKMKAFSEDERNKIMRDIDTEAADISNDMALKRCVLYPYDFAQRMESTEPGKGVPAGLIPLLLDKILEISGWQDVEVEEI